VAKSQNYSHTSGSSSSLTSDAKAAGLRSYGIGGALLHKRVLMMTRSREGRSQEEQQEQQEEQEEQEQQSSEGPKEGEEEEEAAERGSCPSKRRRGRAGRKRSRPQADPGPPRPPESAFRTRMMSPFRGRRAGSQSRESGGREEEEEGAGGVSSCSTSSPQAEQRARRPVSPNPFMWLCRDRSRESA